MSLKEKLVPLIAKVQNKSSSCPWSSVIRSLYPCNFKLRPPQMAISVREEEGDFVLLEFNEKHSFWFPRQTTINLELWNEYLTVFWDHPANAHYYFRGGVFIAAGEVVYDCGACEGFFTQLALNSGASRVVCIEPSTFMASCLRRTFSDEIADGRVVVSQTALASVCGRALFNQHPGEAFTGKLVDSGSDTVDLTTLDKLASEIEQPHLIKMDLEGSEYEALRGGFATLEHNHPKLAITTYHYPWDYAVSKALIDSAGYSHTRCSAATMRQTNIPRAVMLHAWHTSY